jgi:hypothetical protein
MATEMASLIGMLFQSKLSRFSYFGQNMSAKRWRDS